MAKKIYIYIWMGITYQNTLDCDIHIDYYHDKDGSRQNAKHEIAVVSGGRQRCVIYSPLTPVSQWAWENGLVQSSRKNTDTCSWHELKFWETMCLGKTRFLADVPISWTHSLMLDVLLGIRKKLWYFISSDCLRYPEGSELGSKLLASVQWLEFSKPWVYIRSFPFPLGPSRWRWW